MAVEKLILFHINDQLYGMNIDNVSAIEAVKDIVYVPNAPENIEGIINLRGAVIPVYSIHSKFKLPVLKKDKDVQLIITRSKEHTFAFMVDAVDEIYELSSESYLEPPEVLKTEATEYIDGVANVNNKLVLCLNVDYLLSEAEKENMTKFVEQVTKKDE